MVIQVDQEGEKVIKQFCHLALMHAGIENLNSVNKVLSTLVLLSKPPKQPAEKKEPEQDA